MKIKLLMLALVVALSGCDMVLSPTNPVAVATAFWSEALDGDPESASKHMKRGGKLPLGIKGLNSDDQAVLGEVVQLNGIYFIDTVLSVWRNEINYIIPLKTIMVPVDGKWKVDYWSTTASVNDAAIDSSIKYITDSLESHQIIFEKRPNQNDKFAAVKDVESRLDLRFKDAKKKLMKAVRESYGVPEPVEKTEEELAEEEKNNKKR